MRHCQWALWMVAIWSLAAVTGAETVPVAKLVDMLRQVGPQGQGHEAAIKASEHLAEVDATQLPRILSAMDGANPLAKNWLHGAVDVIADRQIARDGKLPLSDLEQFLKDTRHDPRARRLAFELIARVDKSSSDRLIPKMIDDPSVELRRDAVARLLEQADKLLEEKKNDEVIEVYRKAFSAARDLDQVQHAVDKLKKLGVNVDLLEHFGFVTLWKLIGPFDNTDKKAFAVVYPPEKQIDLAATYDGKQSKVAWIDFESTDPFGQVDLNKALGKYNGVAGYATAEFFSDRERPVEIRMGSESAIKLWLNGKLLTEANVYHALTVLDQYVGRGKLKAGRNVILVKVLQNEQKEDWAQDWKFQLRVCDASGTAILSTDRSAAARATKSTPASEKSGAQP